LDPRIRVRHDENDVVQSMGKSFFRRLRRGEFDVAGRDDLWALLVTITLNKACNAADRHFAVKRDVRRNRPIPSDDASQSDAPRGAFAPEDVQPTPAEAAALSAALERRLQTLPEADLRQVAEMKLEGYTNHEIAVARQWSESTVERKLRLIRKRWEAAIEGPV
jgi:DNA-directed RNA polymerase specialized sigma24 family protein